MDEEQIYAMSEGPVIISIGIPVAAPPCDEHNDEAKCYSSSNETLESRRTLSNVVHGLFCSSWVRYVFVILDIILSLAIIYRTKLFQDTPGIDIEQRHELKLIGIKQIASLQAEMVVKMILWNKFQQTNHRKGDKTSSVLWCWYGYMSFSISIEALVFLQVLKQISSLTMWNE